MGKIKLIQVRLKVCKYVKRDMVFYQNALAGSLNVVVESNGLDDLGNLIRYMYNGVAKADNSIGSPGEVVVLFA